MQHDWTGDEAGYNKQLVAYFRQNRNHPEVEQMPGYAEAMALMGVEEETKRDQQRRAVDLRDKIAILPNEGSVLEVSDKPEVVEVTSNDGQDSTIQPE